MTRADVTKHLVRRSAPGSSLANAFQAAGNLNGPNLLNALLFGGFQALQEGLRQARALILG